MIEFSILMVVWFISLARDTLSLSTGICLLCRGVLTIMGEQQNHRGRDTEAKGRIIRESDIDRDRQRQTVRETQPDRQRERERRYVIVAWLASKED